MLAGGLASVFTILGLSFLTSCGGGAVVTISTVGWLGGVDTTSTDEVAGSCGRVCTGRGLCGMKNKARMLAAQAAV